MISCHYAKEEGGAWEPVELPDNAKELMRTLAGGMPNRRRRGVYLEEIAPSTGWVAVVKFPDDMVYDAELLRHGIDPWRDADPWCGNNPARVQGQ